MSHDVLNTCCLISTGRPSSKAGSNLLPITDFDAPVSSMPQVPYVEKYATAGCSLTDATKRLSGCSVIRSFLGRLSFGFWLSSPLPRLPNLRSLSRISSMDETTTWISCQLGTSRVSSCTIGSCMNSIGSALDSSMDWDTAETVMAADVFVEPVDAFERVRSGHSARQWPFLPHNLQWLSRILCWRLFLETLLKYFPLPFDADDLPEPLPWPTGQNPLCLKRSESLLLASAYALYVAARSLSPCSTSAALDS